MNKLPEKLKIKYIYTVTEAARFLGVSADTLRNWGTKGKLIPKRTKGGSRRYYLQQLKTYLKQKGVYDPTPVIPKLTRIFIPKNYITLPLFGTKLLGTGLMIISGVAVVSTAIMIAFSGHNSLISKPAVLGESTQTAGISSTLRINIPAIFTSKLTVSQLNAPNVIYSLSSGDGISVSSGQTPIIKNTGVLSLAGKTGALTLTEGTDITIDGLKITDKSTLDTVRGRGGCSSCILDADVAGGLTISGGTVNDSPIGASTASTGAFTTLTASSTLAVNGGSITTTATTGNLFNTTATTLNIGGAATSVSLGSSSGTTTINNALSVTGATTLTGALSANGNVGLGSTVSNTITFTGRIANGSSILPDTDLGSDLGSSSLRFNNIYVANVNSNSSLSTAGQATFSYAPTDTTYTQSAIIINPTSPVANGFLMGVGVAGYQRAGLDVEGDLTLGYNSSISAPNNSYPLNIYGHSGTSVAYIDASGNLNISGSMTSTGTITTTATSGIAAWWNRQGTTLSAATLTDNIGIGTSAASQLFQVNNNASNPFVVTSAGNVGIGFTTPDRLLQLSADLAPTQTLAGLLGVNGSQLVISGSTASNLQKKLVAGFDTTKNFGYIQAGNSSSGSAYGLNLQPWGGNVGIGTTSPAASLHIASGNIRLGSTADANITGPSGGGSLYIGSGFSYIRPQATFITPTLYRTTLSTEGDGSTYGTNMISATANLGTPTVGGATGGILSATLTDATANTQSFDAFKINVLPGSGSGSGEKTLLRIQQNSSDTFVVKNDRSAFFNGGNVGIGTTSPIQALHVVGQCVAEGTLIRRRRKKKNGEWEEEDVPVEDIKPGDEVLSLNDKTGEWEWHQVEKTLNKDIQTSVLLVTSSGKYIETTWEHPYLVKEGKKAKILGGAYEIDQSNRLEEFNKDSYISIANSKINYTIKITASEKKKLYQIHQEKRFSKFGFQVFAQIINLMLEKAPFVPTNLVIDLEYPGYNKEIEHLILDKLPDLNIIFSSIGKHSPAHFNAYGAYLGKIKVDAVIKSGEIIQSARNGQKKKAEISGENIEAVTPQDKSLTIRSSHGLTTNLYHNRLNMSSQSKWLKVSQVKSGMLIATADGWERVVLIKEVGRKQMYDLQIEGTHNFVGNNIVAHNTYITGNVGIGTSVPGAKLEVGDGTDSLQVSSVGDLTFVDADGAASITGPAGGALTINGGSGQALNLDSGTTGAVNIGTGANAKTVTIGNNTGATALAFTSGTGSQTFTSSVATTTTTSSAWVFTGASLTTGTGAYLNANVLTSGKLMDLSSTSTTLTTGNFFNLDWSPGSVQTTAATGNLFNINIGSNASNFAGNLFNVGDAGSSIFSISKSAVTTSLPMSLTAPGDLSVAYDINMTNPTSSFIKSASALTLQAGEVYNSADLTLKTYNQGSVVIDSAVTTGTAIDIQNTTLTTGYGLSFTGPSSTGITGSALYAASDVGSAGKLLSLAPDFSGSAVTGYGIYNAGTDATANANTDYGYYGSLALTGNAAKNGYGIYQTVTSSSTTADTLYAANLATSVTGIMTTGTRNVYGLYANPSAGAESTGGTTNVYGGYFKSDADVAAGGTVNGYGLYIANGSYDTDGTSTQYGLYVESPTGADTNYAAVFAGGNVGIGTASPGSLLSVNGNVLIGYSGTAAAPANGLAVQGNVGIGTTSPTGLLQVQGTGSMPSLIVTSDGNVGIGTSVTSNPLTVGIDGSTGNGAYLTVGGAWTNGSSREFKDNFISMDSLDILNKINQLSIQQWSYKLEPNVNHIGPIAEDFYSAFGLGNDNKHISTIDPAGVALLGIQALSGREPELQQQIASLSARINELELRDSSRVNDLNLTPPDILLATQSATLKSLNVYSDASISGKLTVYQVQISTDLKVFGNTALGSTAVAGDLNINGTLSLTGNSINSLAFSSTDPDQLGVLYIQDSPLAALVDFFNGQVKITKDGTISAQKVETSKLVILNESEGSLADASSSGKLRDSSQAQNDSIGTSTLLSGTKEIYIETTAVTANSKILVTPTTETDSPLFVSIKEPDKGFKVKIKDTQDIAISFDWLIVDSK